MAAPEVAGEITRMERVSDTPRPTTAVETEPKADPTPQSINNEQRVGTKFGFWIYYGNLW